MKKNLLFILLSFCCIGSQAQSFIYKPFPSDSAIWMEEHVDSYGSYSYERIYMLGDTVIGSLNYNKLYMTYHTWTSFNPVPVMPSNYIGSLRENVATKKVYFVEPGLTAETVLYDFDLNVGDIVTISSVVSSDDTIKVFSIDSVLVNGNYNKRFVLGSATAGAVGTVGNLIEGVGNEAGLRNLYRTGFEFSDQLLCLSVYQNIIYPYGASFPSSYCAYAVGIGELVNDAITLTIMPNPASDAVTISVGCQETYSIEVKNSLGEAVFSKANMRRSESMIDLTGYSAGIYFIRLSDSKGNAVTKRIVKE